MLLIAYADEEVPYRDANDLGLEFPVPCNQISCCRSSGKPQQLTKSSMTWSCGLRSTSPRATRAASCTASQEKTQRPSLGSSMVAACAQASTMQTWILLLGSASTSNGASVSQPSQVHLQVSQNASYNLLEGLHSKSASSASAECPSFLCICNTLTCLQKHPWHPSAI